MKKLERSKTDKKISGVCSGIGVYFGVDSTLIRILFIIALFFSLGTAILAYILMAFIIPEETDIFEQ